MSQVARIGNNARRSDWDNRTITRRLHGIEYQILEDPYDIHDYINTEIAKELEADLEGLGLDPKQDPTLSSLSRRKWKLEIVNVADVHLNTLIMNSSDVRTGRAFTERLRERRSELLETLKRGSSRIEPIVVLYETQILVDGYCRHSALMEMGVTNTFAYSGRVVHR
jgi:hypothetical protein